MKITAALLTTLLCIAACGGSDSSNENVLGSCIHALGGRETLQDITVIHTIDSLTMAGMSGSTESWWIRDPFTGFSVTEIGPVTQQVLIQGDSVWTVDRNGHLSPGGVEERDQMELSRITVFYDYLLDSTLVTMGPDTLIDSVLTVPLYLKDQPNVVFYYSRETWLPLLMTARTMGIEILSYPSDYRSVDGIVSATGNVSLMPALGQEIVTRNIITEYNVPVPESIFVLSAASTDWELESSDTPYPFDLSGEHIFLDGTVNGNPVRILLDSGAGATVMDSSLAAELGLETAGQMPAQGIGGTREFTFVRVESYSAAGAVMGSQTIAVMPLSDEFYSATGEKIDLIIGYDFLSRFITRIDYGGGEITLFNPDSFSTEGLGLEIIPARRGMSLLSLEALLEDSIPARLLLDTGAGGNLHLTGTFFERNGEFLEDRDTFETEMQGVGGFETIAGFRVSSVALGDFTVPGGLCSSFSGGDIFSEYDGILGNGILARFILYLDYRNSRIMLKPSSLFDSGLPESMTGIGLEIRDGSLAVRSVIDGSAAAAAGIQPDDILLSIGDIAVSGEDLNGLDSILPDQPGEIVFIRVLRDGEEVETELVTERLVPLQD